MGRLFFYPQATFRHSGIHWLCGHGGGGHAITNNLHHLEPDYVQTLPNMTRRRCDSSALGFASLRPLEGCFLTPKWLHPVARKPADFPQQASHRHRHQLFQTARLWSWLCLKHLLGRAILVHLVSHFCDRGKAAFSPLNDLVCRWKTPLELHSNSSLWSSLSGSVSLAQCGSYALGSGFLQSPECCFPTPTRLGFAATVSAILVWHELHQSESASYRAFSVREVFSMHKKSSALGLRCLLPREGRFSTPRRLAHIAEISAGFAWCELRQP
jgi:hypothetical protein